MLRALLAAVALATAYCGAKGPPRPPAPEAADAGAQPPPSAPPDAGVP
jgi:hypothetical protein